MGRLTFDVMFIDKLRPGDMLSRLCCGDFDIGLVVSNVKIQRRREFTILWRSIGIVPVHISHNVRLTYFMYKRCF